MDEVKPLATWRRLIGSLIKENTIISFLIHKTKTIYVKIRKILILHTNLETSFKNPLG